MAGPITFLKSDLNLAFDVVKAEPGDVLIIRPRDRNSQFSAEYIDWLRHNVGDLIPRGVRTMILTDDSTEFVRLTTGQWPNMDQFTSDTAFALGWRAAFDALEDYYRRREPIHLGIVE